MTELKRKGGHGVLLQQALRAAGRSSAVGRLVSRIQQLAIRDQQTKKDQAGARRPVGKLNNDDVSSNVSNQQEATAQTSSWYWKGLELDFLEEKRARAAVRLAAYQRRMEQSYNKRVRPRKYELGDLVWRKIQYQGDRGKLDPKYEGPYKVVGKTGITAYYLEDAHGKRGRRPWNIIYLRKYYS
ncbi:hypothetical protein F511_33645 [Dorcoceras hygrometricum]|uniref:Uncharacterized protein n=1 Tax=Dorcoceras hygrometricum TaxID=472368 RepID=A0A2Z7C4P5_9LAMI|nr:hypothetical protein F511_33645 [Dorcoceras hygrometricum]